MFMSFQTVGRVMGSVLAGLSLLTQDPVLG